MTLGQRKALQVGGKRYTGRTFALQCLMTLLALVFLSPIFMVINYSFKTKQELYLSNPLALPDNLYLDNYLSAFKKLNMPTTFLNTVLYTAVAVLCLAMLCGAAAWAIARCKKFFFRASYIYFLVGILIPTQALFLPIYIIGYRLGLTNTSVGIILMYIASGMSFGVFLMTSFMNTVPVELEEAARIDGCSVYGIYFRIVLPLLRPAMATLVIMQSFQIWNDYLMANLFASNKQLKTITVAMQALFSTQTSDYTTALAAVIISVLPMIILFVALQKYFVKGMTLGAVKG